MRIKNHVTKTGLKKKLRNDLWSDPIKVTKIVSDQNIEIDLNGTLKIVHIDNVKRKEPDRLTNQLSH